MEFASEYIEKYEDLESLGYKSGEIRRMLGSMEFVKDFVDTPEWLECVYKLPKGNKWADGQRYSLKAGPKNDGEQYIFLQIGNDLYIKNILNWWATKKEEDGFVFCAVKDKRICLIRDWRTMTAVCVVSGLRANMTPYKESAFFDFWKKNGGRIGFNETILR
jgi:hypothetical protein